MQIHTIVYMYICLHVNIYIYKYTYLYTYTYISIYKYIPEGPGVLRWRSGGVGWGMLPSCSCYVDATLMGGVGWGGACYRHVHVTLMLRCC